jgi:hypothetical protein
LEVENEVFARPIVVGPEIAGFGMGLDLASRRENWRDGRREGIDSLRFYGDVTFS